MDIAIVGAGAMGCLFGAMLHPRVPHIVLIDIWEDHVKAINAQGLVVEQNGETRQCPIKACLPRDAHHKPDMIILFTKTFHTESALSAVQQIIGPETCLMTLQNGMGQVEIIERFIPASRIIHGITTFPCDIVGPGHIRTKGDGLIKFMSMDGEHHDMLDRIESLFNQSGLNSQITPDVKVSIWEKLAFNAVMNALSAVLRANVGEMADAAEARQLATRIVDEVECVAQKQGVSMDRGKVEGTIAMAFREHRDHKPSMLQDVLKQKRTEIDYINGAVVKLGTAAGVSTPVNETLVALVKALEHGYLS